MALCGSSIDSNERQRLRVRNARHSTGDFKMAKVAPYHTNSPEYPPEHREVYHDKDTCPAGKRIKSEHREQGTGNKKHCLQCDKAN